MKGFEPSLLEKLFDDEPRSPATGMAKRFTLDRFKESVATDIEGLLNSRMVLSEELLAPYVQARRSVLTYGLCDFSGMSLASSHDRKRICESIERTIAIHEPRLRNVQVSLELDRKGAMVLRFTISALLLAHPASEPVSFDAMLQPATLQYSVTKSRRAQAA